MTKVSDGKLQARSRRSSDLRELIGRRFDVILSAPSWDERCRSLTSVAELCCTSTILINYAVRDPEGCLRGNADEIHAFLHRRSDRVSVIEGDSRNILDLWERVSESLATAVIAARRPISILLDSSTVPRFLPLAILGTFLNRGAIHAMTILYEEAEYPEQQQTEWGPRDIEFGGGEWRAIPVPGLEGTTSPGFKSFFLVSVGFEGTRTFRVVTSADPDRVSVLFPDPGVSAGYVERTQENNHDLLDAYGIEPRQIVRAHASDAVAAWSSLMDAHLERLDGENVTYLCCGTKPHSLALGLRALSLKSPTVLYYVPDERKVVYVKPAGTYWTYEIRNLASPFR